MRRGLTATGVSVLLAVVVAGPSAAAPAAKPATTWYWTSQRAESRVLEKLGVPAYCRGVGEVRDGERVVFVHDQRFVCLSPRLDGTVWSFTLEVRGNHRFVITADREGTSPSGQ